MDGFLDLIQTLLIENAVEPSAIHTARGLTYLPGWFRSEKQWDLLVMHESKLIACVELKSQVGSFGNNFNNRAEEAIGNASDVHIAYREGAFSPSPRPWLGYLMLLEDTPKSRMPIRNYEPHFQIFPEFKGSSYEVRYRELLLRLTRERLYDSACFLMSDSADGDTRAFREPSSELSLQRFFVELVGAVVTRISSGTG